MTRDQDASGAVELLPCPNFVANLRDRAGMVRALKQEISEGYQGWLDDAAEFLDDAAGYFEAQINALVAPAEQQGATAPAGGNEAVAVIGKDWSLLWASPDTLTGIVVRTGITIGSKLYAHPPTPNTEPTGGWQQEQVEATPNIPQALYSIRHHLAVMGDTREGFEAALKDARSVVARLESDIAALDAGR